MALVAALLSRPAAEAASPTFGPVSIIFTGLVVDGESFDRLGLSVDAETGETAYSGRVPVLTSPTEASWESVEISFDVVANDIRERFFWKLDAARIADISYNSTGRTGLVGVLEGFSIGQTDISRGEFSIRHVDGRGMATSGEHGEISIDGMTGDKLGTASVSGFKTAMSGLLPDYDMNLRFEFDEASLSGLDIAYLDFIEESMKPAIGQVDEAADIADFIESLIGNGSGYDAFEMDGIRGDFRTPDFDINVVIEHVGNEGVHGLRQGAATTRGASLQTETGFKFAFQQASWSEVDLTEPARELARLLREQPELFDVVENREMAFLRLLPAFDMGSGEMHAISYKPQNDEPLTISAISVGPVAKGSDGKIWLGMAVDGAVVPKGHLAGAEPDIPMQLLEHAGLSQLGGDLSLELVLDVDRPALTIDSFKIEADQLADLYLTAGVVFPDKPAGPGQPQGKLETLKLKFADDRLLDAVFALQDVRGMPLIPPPAEIVQQLRGMQVAMNTEPGRKVYDDLIAFVEGASNLEASLNPQQPVPMQQVAGILLLGADAAIQFLGLDLRVWR
jgi:hypothetical protein